MRISIYPNPVNKYATIEYELPESGNVSISILNLMGQQVTSLFSGFKPRGLQKLPINSNGFSAAKLPAGSYLLKIDMNGKSKVQQFKIMP